MRPLATAVRLLPQGGAILCLHGIHRADQTDGGGIHVDEARFRSVLDMVSSAFTVAPLPELLTRHESGRSTSGLLAITFDDACLSVSTLAAPLLRARGAPASIFAVRDATRSGTPFWWDRLSLLATGFATGEWTALCETLGVAAAAPLGDTTPLRDAIVARHRGLLPPSADAVLTATEARLGSAGGYDRSMTELELQVLARDSLFDIGVHTNSHRALPLLSDTEATSEIAECFAWLQGLLPAPLPVLAIPFGLRDQRTALLARQAGMRSVLRIAPRTLRAATDIDGYPRFMVSERRSGWKLGAGLLGVQEVLRSLGLRSGPDDPVMPVVSGS